MVLKRCIHCGHEGDDEIASLTHKSTCRTRGKAEDYIILEQPRPRARTVTIESEESSPKKSAKKSHGSEK